MEHFGAQTRRPPTFTSARPGKRAALDQRWASHRFSLPRKLHPSRGGAAAPPTHARWTPPPPALPASPPPAGARAGGCAPAVSAVARVPELRARCRHDRPEDPLLFLLPDPHREADHAQPRAGPGEQSGGRGQRRCGGETRGVARDRGDGGVSGRGAVHAAAQTYWDTLGVQNSRALSAAAMPRHSPMGIGPGRRRANRCTACPHRPSRGPITGGRGREQFCREKPTWGVLDARSSTRQRGTAVRRGPAQESRAPHFSARLGHLRGSKQPCASTAAMPRYLPVRVELGRRRANGCAACPLRPAPRMVQSEAAGGGSCFAAKSPRGGSWTRRRA